MAFPTPPSHWHFREAPPGPQPCPAVRHRWTRLAADIAPDKVKVAPLELAVGRDDPASPAVRSSWS